MSGLGEGVLLVVARGTGRYAGSHVVRLYVKVDESALRLGSVVLLTSEGLDDARRQIASRWPGLVQVARADGDDPAVLEAWAEPATARALDRDGKACA